MKKPTKAERDALVLRRAAEWLDLTVEETQMAADRARDAAITMRCVAQQILDRERAQARRLERKGRR